MWDNSNGCKLATWIEPTRVRGYVSLSQFDRQEHLERPVRDAERSKTGVQTLVGGCVHRFVGESSVPSFPGSPPSGAALVRALDLEEDGLGPLLSFALEPVDRVRIG